ncbi:MAG: hypothetical protein ABIT08_06620 [Bacteroidia bacterium]
MIEQSNVECLDDELNDFIKSLILSNDNDNLIMAKTIVIEKLIKKNKTHLIKGLNDFLSNYSPPFKLLAFPKELEEIIKEVDNYLN